MPHTQSPAFSAVLALSQQTGLPVTYREDLDLDQVTLSSNPNAFLYILRQHGTVLILEGTPEALATVTYYDRERYFAVERAQSRELTHAQALEFLRTLPAMFRVTNTPEGGPLLRLDHVTGNRCCMISDAVYADLHARLTRQDADAQAACLAHWPRHLRNA